MCVCACACCLSKSFSSNKRREIAFFHCLIYTETHAYKQWELQISGAQADSSFIARQNYVRSVEYVIVLSLKKKEIFLNYLHFVLLYSIGFSCSERFRYFSFFAAFFFLLRAGEKKKKKHSSIFFPFSLYSEYQITYGSRSKKQNNIVSM